MNYFTKFFFKNYKVYKSCFLTIFRTTQLAKVSRLQSIYYKLQCQRFSFDIICVSEKNYILVINDFFLSLYDNVRC